MFLSKSTKRTLPVFGHLCRLSLFDGIVIRSLCSVPPD